MVKRKILPFWFALFLIPSITHSQVTVIGELSQERQVSPGATYEGAITVRNDLDEPQEARIYQTDYLFRFDGSNEYGEPGSVPRSNAQWIAFNPSYLVIPPKSTMAVSYTVTVPKTWKGGELIGTYWSMIMVEGIDKGSPESALPRENVRAQMGIRQTIRYAIQIITNIGETGSPNIGFLGPKLVTRDDGRRVFQIDLENTGDRGVRPDVYVELFNEKGVLQGKFPGTSMRLYPGTSVRQMIDLTEVPKGTYRALVVVDADGDDIIGAQYTLKS